jgi:hypothetical protein
MSSTGVSSGKDNKLYVNSTADNVLGGSGTYASPDWVIIDRIGDLDRSGSKATTEVDMRASDTTITIYGNKSREITFTYYKRKGSGDTIFNTLLDSFENNTCLDIAMAEADIATSGTVYDRGPFIVAEMEKTEPIGGVESYDVTLNFADAEQVAGGGVPFLYLPNQQVA